MMEIALKCIKVQCEYSDIPLQDKIYIAFGRIVTEREYDLCDLVIIINEIKSELEFLEGVWNGKDGES